MMGAFLGNEEQGAEIKELALTQTYGTLNDIIARNKSVSFPSEGLVGAVVEGLQMPAGIKTEEVLSPQRGGCSVRCKPRGGRFFLWPVSQHGRRRSRGIIIRRWCRTPWSTMQMISCLP